MNANDQFFSPGDKVTRVAYGDTIGPLASDARLIPQTDFGKVLCVLACWPQRNSAGQVLNRVAFVGLPESVNDFYAACFRRISEIQLCVRAASHLKRGQETQREGVV